MLRIEIDKCRCCGIETDEMWRLGKRSRAQLCMERFRQAGVCVVEGKGFQAVLGQERNLPSLAGFRPTLRSSNDMDVAIDCEHEHPFADLDIDIGKEREGLRAGDFAHLLAELVTA